MEPVPVERRRVVQLQPRKRPQEKNSGVGGQETADSPNA